MCITDSQYRAYYDRWDSPLGDLIHFPNGQQIREVIHHADRRYIAEAQAIYANSGNVSQRLKHYCGIDSTPLYHPPQHAECFYSGEAHNSLFFPSRINRTKRQDLVIEALAHTQEAVSYTHLDVYKRQVKHRQLGKQPIRSKLDLNRRIHSSLKFLQEQMAKVRSFFQLPDAQYAALQESIA